MRPRVSAGPLLHPLSAPVERVAGKGNDVEGVHDGDRVGDGLGGRGLEAGESVHRDHPDAVAERGCLGVEPGLEHLLRTALDHVQQPGWAGAGADRGEVDDHGDERVPVTGVPPAMLVDPDHRDAVEPVRVVDQRAAAFGQDGVVGGVPADGELLRRSWPRIGAGRRSRSAPSAAPGARAGLAALGRLAGVLAPHMRAVAAPVAAHRDQQRGRSPPQRLVRQAVCHGVARQTLPAAAMTPVIRIENPTGQHRPTRFEPLARSPADRVRRDDRRSSGQGSRK